MKNMINLLICLFVIVTLASCAITYKYGPYIGKVVDAQTEEPIEGAAVHIRFVTNRPNPGGGTSSYAGAVECLTDKNGEFNLSYRAVTFRVLSLWDKQPRINVFKPGYGVFPGYKGTSITPKPEWCCIEEGVYGIIRLPKLNSKKERRRNLGRISVGVIPFEDMKIIRELKNQERIYLGLGPYRFPKASEK